MVDSLRYLQAIGSQVQETFLKNKTILTFQEYLDAFGERPRVHARSAAQFIRDCFDHYGTEQVKTPAGLVRRFKLFDRPFDFVSDGGQDPGQMLEGEGGAPVSGQEEAQNAIYRILNTFVRAGRVNKLILLHGPNGSAKSSIVAAIQRALEDYSRKEEGALYRYNWIFPSEKLGKGSIGFGDVRAGTDRVGSYAHLEGEEVDARIVCEMRDHPLWLLPRRERRKLLEQECKPDGNEGKDGFLLSPALLEGELCHKCRQIYAALLQSYNGDVLRVLRHVQVERFYISRRYMAGAVTVEPQMSVDAEVRQLTSDRSHHALPGSLQNLSLYEPYGPLVAGNRGLVEFSDLLKRPLEHYKYLLGTIETGIARMQLFLLHLDMVLIASSNEKHLSAFKEISDFPSFKGRIELVRVPYLRRVWAEKAIYDQQLTAVIPKHVAPHATEVAAQWAVLTRLKKPVADRYKGEVRKLVDHLSPPEKMRLYDKGDAPDRLSSAQAKELKKQLTALFGESDTYPNYEGRSGASAREVKTVIFNAAQGTYHCLTPQAILEELEQLCKDKSVYEFLQQEVVDGYHDHEEFVRVVEAQYLDALDEEVREAMGLVSERQYAELFERYVQHVVAWTRGERLRNKHTGEQERPDEEMMAQTETIVLTGGEDRREFRRGLISAIGAHRIENPDSDVIDYSQIFPDLFRRLRDHFYDERKRTLRKNAERVLRFLGDERTQLASRDIVLVEQTLTAMKTRYGYCEHCAKDALVLLLGKRYND